MIRSTIELNNYLYILIVIIIIITFIRPFWGLLLLILTVPLEGLLAKSALMSMTKAYGVLLLVASFRVIIGRVGRLFARRTIIIYLLFIFWSIASILWADNSMACLLKNSTFFSLFLFLLLMILMGKDDDDGILYLRFL